MLHAVLEYGLRPRSGFGPQDLGLRFKWTWLQQAGHCADSAFMSGILRETEGTLWDVTMKRVLRQVHW